MTEQSPPRARIRFGIFELDVKSQELFKEGRRVPLANQSFQALALLLERPGQLVSREEFRQRIWPDGRVVEFDQGLNTIINRLRETLGQVPGGPAFIETLPRRGYRFVGVLTPDEPVQPHPETRRRKAAATWALSGGLTILAVLALLLASHGGAHADGGPRVEPLTSLIGREIAPSFDPVGEHLLFAWNGGAQSGGRFLLYSKSIGSEALQAVTREPATALHAAWRPGGKQIALARRTEHDSGIYLLTPGEPEQLLTPAIFFNEAFMQLSWSPDGSRLAYATIGADGRSHIGLIDVASRAQQLLQQPAACTDTALPAFSADGQRVAFVCTSSVAVYHINVRELGTGALRVLASLQGSPQGLAWAADGHAVIVANDSDIDSGIWRITLAGEASRLLRSPGSLGPGTAVTAGRIAFVHEDRVVDIWRADLSAPASPSSSLISSTREQLVPEYSPDGLHIAFESNRSGSSEIWLADADGGNPVKRTSFNGPLTGAPSWCSDGQRIAFDSRASGASAIYVLDLRQGQPHRLRTQVPGLALPVWSQDCRWILASDGRTALYRVSVADGNAELFTHKHAYRAVVAGSRVLFNVVGDSSVELWASPIGGGPETTLPDMPPLRSPDSWTATANGIYFTSSIGTSSTSPTLALSFYDFDSHRTREVRRLDGTAAALGGLGLAVSRDERWVLYTRSERSEADVMMISSQAPIRAATGSSE